MQPLNPCAGTWAQKLLLKTLKYISRYAIGESTKTHPYGARILAFTKSNESSVRNRHCEAACTAPNLGDFNVTKILRFNLQFCNYFLSENDSRNERIFIVFPVLKKERTGLRSAPRVRSQPNVQLRSSRPVPASCAANWSAWHRIHAHPQCMRTLLLHRTNCKVRRRRGDRG